METLTKNGVYRLWFKAGKDAGMKIAVREVERLGEKQFLLTYKNKNG